MPSPDVPGDEQAKPNPRHRTEADQLDAGNANTANAKTSNEALSLLERQSLSKKPVSGTGAGHEGKGDLSRKEPFTGKSAATSEVIRNGQLLVSSLWTPDLDEDDPENQAPKPDGQEKEQSKDKPGDKPGGKPYLESTQSTQEEFDSVRRTLPISPELEQRLEGVMTAIEQQQKESWKNVKELINKIGKPPKDALVDAMRNSQVVGIGEMHTNGVNPHRDLGASIMQDLHNQGGATHLAVEFPKVLQPVLDKFNNDPAKGELEIPDKIIGPDGKEDTSEEARGALKFLHTIKEKAPDLIKVLSSARDAGMKVVCVDNNSSALLYADPKHPSIPQLMSQRDQDMKDNVMSIIDQPVKPGDPPPKVLAWLGELHFADSHGTEKQKSAGELLRTELDKRHQKITTFGSQIGNSRTANGTSLYPLTSTLTRPVSVATHDQGGQTNALGQMHLFTHRQEGFPDYNLSSFDHMMVFPKVQEHLAGVNLGGLEGGIPQNTEVQPVVDKMKDTKPASEVKPDKYLSETANDHEAALLKLDREKVIAAKKEVNTEGKPPTEVLSEAMKNSRVLGIEELAYYHNALGNAPDSLAMMKSLKDAGATHVVVPFKQDVLDEFMKTGKVDSKKVMSIPGNQLILMNMQAALQNGLKLVSSFDASAKPGAMDMPTAQREAEAVRDVLKDRNAKVILLTDGGRMANTEDRNGQKSTGQLLRNESDPAHPSEKIKLTSVSQVDPHDTVLTPISELLADLKQPVAIPMGKAQVVAKVKAGSEFDYKTPPQLDSWDILMAWP